MPNAQSAQKEKSAAQRSESLVDCRELTRQFQRWTPREPMRLLRPQSGRALSQQTQTETRATFGEMKAFICTVEVIIYSSLIVLNLNYVGIKL